MQFLQVYRIYKFHILCFIWYLTYYVHLKPSSLQLLYIIIVSSSPYTWHAFISWLFILYLSLPKHNFGIILSLLSVFLNIFLFTAYLDSSQSSITIFSPWHYFFFFFHPDIINNVNKHVLMSILLDFCPYLAISSIYNFT